VYLDLPLGTLDQLAGERHVHLKGICYRPVEGAINFLVREGGNSTGLMKNDCLMS
jgi:hypothetical protein